MLYIRKMRAKLQSAGPSLIPHRFRRARVPFRYIPLLSLEAVVIGTAYDFEASGKRGLVGVSEAGAVGRRIMTS